MKTEEREIVRAMRRNELGNKIWSKLCRGRRVRANDLRRNSEVRWLRAA
jgi:hypothetical protein